MDKIFTRKIKVSHEDMERINESVEKWRARGIPEHKIKEYFYGMIHMYGTKEGEYEEENKSDPNSVALQGRCRGDKG